MPLVGDSKAAGDVIDVDNSGLNGNDLMANGTGNGYDNGTLTDKIKEINEIPENRISLDQLLLNLVNSGDEKHAKLALDLFDLNWMKGNESEKLEKMLNLIF